MEKHPKMKNDILKIEQELKSSKIVALLAPSFIAEFEYPSIISQLKKLGFDKVVELTFGAKMINKDYHKILKNSKQLWISSTCPGITEVIERQFPNYKKNIIKIDSPMVAMGKICKKYFPKHKTIFISPCHFKKNEAEKTKYIDYTLDYQQLKQLLAKYKIKTSKKKIHFDKFYNDYTKIYPLSGGLKKTIHMKGVLKEHEILILDGIKELEDFLKKPNKQIKFLDITFCKGGCIGGPCFTNKSLKTKKQKLMKYIEYAKIEKIPKNRKGLIKEAKGLKFTF
jgi:iron only hydrogenase large subunit-like protein